jgi:iron complex outermembrane receptor protein
MRKKETIVGALALAALAGATPAALAATDKPAKEVGASASGEEILFQELPSVFGASKYQQKPSEAPAWVTLITAEEIEKYGHRTLAEVLRSVPGFYATDDRNYTYLGVRGFNRPGDYNTRVLLLVDGHRLNDNVYDAAYYGTESFVDVETIERVEVIRGPSSSLYGTNAFFAVINIITKSGRALKGMELSADPASFGTFRGHVAGGAKTAKGPEFYLSATLYDSEGQDLFYTEYDDPLTNDGVAEGADGDDYLGFFGKVSAGNLSFAGGFKRRQKSIPTASYSTLFNESGTETTDTRYYFSGSYDAAVGKRSRIGAALSYDWYDYKGDYVYDYGGTPGLFKDYSKGAWYTGNVQFTTSPGERQKLVFGAELRANVRQDQGASDPTTPSLFDSQESSTIWALFAQDEIHINDHFILNLGLRHDDYETFGGTTNPRAALIFPLAGGHSLKVLYGKAFRAPNNFEVYYDDGLTTKGNTALEPETIDTYEIAWERLFGRGMRAVAAVYHYRVKDLISQIIDPNDGFLVFENIDRVEADGGELSLEGKLARRLDLRVSYSYQDSKNEATEDDLTNSPHHMIKLNLGMPLLGEKLSAGLEAQSMSRRLQDGGGTTESFALVNLTLMNRDLVKGLVLTGGIYNLLDEEYADPVGAELDPIKEVAQNERHYRFQLKYLF